MKKWLLTYRKHLYFWATAYMIFLGFLLLNQPFWEAFTRSVVMGVFSPGLVYLNLLWAIPTLLHRRWFVLYILWSALVLVGLTVLRTYLDVWMLPPFPTGDFFQNPYAVKMSFYYWLTNNFFFYVSLIYSLSTDLSREKQQKAELQKQHIEAELKFLKYQLHPHFLLNTLNNLYSMAYRQHPAAPELILRLSDCMKYLLYESEHEQVYLEDEIRFMQSYIALHQLRLDYPDRIKFEYEGVKPGHRLPPLLFLAFVENIFKHADTDNTPEGFAFLRLWVDPAQARLYFQGENTTKARKTNLLEKSGIGLANVRQRLDLLFENTYVLKTEQMENTFLFYLEIPL
ncbi:MAG: histidine kinase [Microscillaceae bacterium]|nr:histidine kinase [Microscillaceae bacterium]